MEKAETKGAAFDFYGKLPLTKAVPLGLQHVLAMFVGNLTPILIITGACGIGAGSEFAELQVDLLQNAMLVAGIVTLVQLYAIGPVGGKVPIIMGTSSGFIGVFNSVAKVMGGGIAGYGAIMLASVLGGLFETVLGFLLKPLRRFFPAVVTGTVVLSIGLSLVSVGVGSFGGGNAAADFGSLENLALGALVTVVIIAFKHGTKGMTSASSILIGIIAGYIASAVMGLFLSPTGITADGVEYTKAWVLNWDKVAEAPWFSIPKLMPVPLVFDLRAIVPVLIMFIVTAVETVGDISGVMEGGMGREATDSELSGGVICDGLGSSFAALFGVLPNTSFSQNVGLVAMTKIVNRHALATGAVFLVFCGDDVFIHRHQRHPADHKGAADSQEHHHRIHGPGTWLRHWCQWRSDRRTSRGSTADLRRLRYRSGSDPGHCPEHCDHQREGGLKGLAAGFRTESRKEAGRYLDTRAYQKRSRRALFRK